MRRLLKLVIPIVGRIQIVKYVVLGMLTGLCSFLFINIVTRVIALLIANKITVINREYLLGFIAVILLFVWSKRSLALISIQLSLKISWSLRKRIISLLLDAQYKDFSQKVNSVQTAILSDVGALTNASLSVIDFSISTILALCCFFYLSTISIVLFVVTLFTAIIGVSIYYFSSKGNVANLENARKLENVFQSHLNSLINGFKEVFMDSRKGKYIFQEKICANAEASFKQNLSALSGLINNQIVGQVLFYLLISSVLLIFSVLLKITPSRTVSFVFTLLYLLASIESIMVQLPTLIRAGVAADQIINLTFELRSSGKMAAVEGKSVFNNHITHIKIRELSFEYGQQNEVFGIGPISLDINKGDAVFIYGGNGSGKTTFIYTLLGLCASTKGTVFVDGNLLREENLVEYKRLFAVIFSDFHLFDQFLAIEPVDSEKWWFYLRLFELETKVTLENNILSTTDLSTGQKKRLALIIALLENKPILVLDEWAADQDPFFRRKFYKEIIPYLLEQGMTIIAITHDDKYFDCATRLFKMSEGQLSIESMHAPSPLF